MNVVWAHNTMMINIYVFARLKRLYGYIYVCVTRTHVGVLLYGQIIIQIIETNNTLLYTIPLTYLSIVNTIDNIIL